MFAARQRRHLGRRLDGCADARARRSCPARSNNNADTPAEIRQAPGQLNLAPGRPAQRARHYIGPRRRSVCMRGAGGAGGRPPMGKSHTLGALLMSRRCTNECANDCPRARRARAPIGRGPRARARPTLSPARRPFIWPNECPRERAGRQRARLFAVARHRHAHLRAPPGPRQVERRHSDLLPMRLGARPAAPGGARPRHAGQRGRAPPSRILGLIAAFGRKHNRPAAAGAISRRAPVISGAALARVVPTVAAAGPAGRPRQLAGPRALARRARRPRRKVARARAPLNQRALNFLSF